MTKPEGAGAQPEKAEGKESLPDLWRDLFGRFFAEWPSFFRRPEVWRMPEVWREWLGGEMMPVEELTTTLWW